MRASHGFTLLEVLAAVAVIGVAFTSLAAWNIDGLRAESRAQSRLQASLVADQALADFESELAAGTTPPIGRLERELDGYAVRLEIESLELALEDPPTTPGAPRIQGEEAAGPTLIAPPGSRRDTPLRLVRITVGFGDEGARDSVVRETFAFDAEAVATLMQGLEAQGTPPGGAPRSDRGARGRTPRAPRPDAAEDE
jgi:prepilin-type N-terminal cleavage/methylation domain-containing protein